MSQSNYHLGGLAELCPNPTPLTLSFLQHYFTGANSLGLGMKLLGMPFARVLSPLLTVVNDRLVVDLSVEEKTLYASTIFAYAKQQNPAWPPRLKIAPQKMLNLFHIFPTFKILFHQALWIANPEQVDVMAQAILAKIPNVSKDQNLEETDRILAKHCFPAVIAIGALAEFFAQVSESKEANEGETFSSDIQNAISQKDWLLKSFTDQAKVKSKDMSFKDFLQEYGLRADQDYEIACPRWMEMETEMKRRLENINWPEKKNDKEIEVKFDRVTKTLINLQIYRSLARKKTLPHISQLRNLIIKQNGSDDIANLTREEVFSGQPRPATVSDHKSLYSPTSHIQPTHHQGVGVSKGVTSGKVLHITTNTQAVPAKTVGIFQNPTPEFTMQFAKCQGIIFLSGGVTSHGAIVARELGIPAIIDPEAHSLPNKTEIEINGESGEWKKA